MSNASKTYISNITAMSDIMNELYSLYNIHNVYHNKISLNAFQILYSVLIL